MIEPTAPIVPGDKDDCFLPQIALRDLAYAIQRPLHPQPAESYRADQSEDSEPRRLPAPGDECQRGFCFR